MSNVKDAIERRLQETGLPGLSLAVVTSSKLAWSSAFGAANKTTNEPVSNQHLLQACSISKFISAILTLRVAECCGVDLDADVNQYLTSWQMPHYNLAQPVTLRSLLCHQAGIQDPDGSFDSPEPGETAPTPLDILTGRSRLHPKLVVPEQLPYAGFAYSDAGYCVVEQALQDITGKPFSILARELLFQPLGIRDCRFEQPLSTDEPGVVLARGHTPSSEVLPSGYPVYPYLAAAGLWCTPSAFAKVLAELVRAGKGQSEVLSQQLVQELLVEPGAKHIGLGNFRSGSTRKDFVFHLGWGKGFQCEFRLWPEQGDGVVVMLNANPGVEQSESLVGETAAILTREFGLGQ